MRFTANASASVKRTRLKEGCSKRPGFKRKSDITTLFKSALGDEYNVVFDWRAADKEGVTQEGPMIEERLTEDLLARLLAAPNPDSYLGEGLTLQRSLADYLHELLAAKRLETGRRIGPRD